ncbi:hypothetical protein BJ741DRAFT_59710 [Chytriomyces cf. hyalinus JEL632]|nr:hypothetical protein BJ741DRAFT_59710 [Chytriomyces cf. hyalinus JEL632]
MILFSCILLAVAVVAPPPPIPAERAVIASMGASNPMALAQMAADADKLIPHLHASDFAEQKLNHGGDWLIFFGSSTCTHCQMLTPKFLNLYTETKQEYETRNFHLAKIECTDEIALCRSRVPQINAFPSLRLYHQGSFLREHSTGVNEPTIIKQFIQTHFDSLLNQSTSVVQQLSQLAEYLSTPDPEITNPLGQSVALTWTTFDAKTKSSPWLIKFYSPHCGHCISFAPTWTNIANNLQRKLNAGDVDCSKETRLCNRFSIHAYPTVVHVAADGITQQIFRGQRTMEAISAFATSIKPADTFTAITLFQLESTLATDSGVHFFLIYNPDHLVDIESLAPIVQTFAKANEPLKICPEESAQTMFPGLPPSSITPQLLVTHGEPYDRETRRYESTILLSTTLQSQATLLEWIQRHAQPVLYHLTELNAHQIMNGENLVVLALLQRLDLRRMADEQSVTDLLRAAARRWMERKLVAAKVIGSVAVEDPAFIQNQPIRFAWIDADDRRGYLFKHFGVVPGSVDTPQLVVVDTKREVFYDTVLSSTDRMKFVGVSSVLDHVENVISGRLIAKPVLSTTRFRTLRRFVRKMRKWLNGHPALGLIAVVGVVYLLMKYARRAASAARYSITKGD